MSAIDATPIKPKTFEELKEMASAVKMCQRCGKEQATHTISMTAASVSSNGKRGTITATVPRVPVCEACGVDIFAVVKRALRA